VIHHFVARLDVETDTPFVDPNHGQNLGLHPFEHGFRVRGIAHGDLLCAYEGGVHRVLFLRLLGLSGCDPLQAPLLMQRSRIAAELQLHRIGFE
jgi:hypothetical protein